MTSALTLYNAALVEIGQGRLASLSDTAKSRYELDAVYSDVVADCLEAGSWNFALRAVQLDADATITPAFGWTDVFAKPTDFVRTAMLSGDENFSIPLNEYGEENGVWLANVTPIYVQYVSNGADYGLDLTAWPRTFARFVELSLAERVAIAITQSDTQKERLIKLMIRAKRDAMNKDAMGEAPKFPPQGSWNNARGGSSRLNGTRRGL